MSTSDVVNIVGLLVGTVGAILLAYDVVYGPGKRFRAKVIKTQLDVLQNNRFFVRARLKALAKPPYTDEEIKKLLDEEEAQFGPQEQALSCRINATFRPAKAAP